MVLSRNAQLVWVLASKFIPPFVVSQAALRRGVKSAGDLIPWTVAQQFQDHKFASLSGARVVRIAVCLVEDTHTSMHFAFATFGCFSHPFLCKMLGRQVHPDATRMGYGSYVRCSVVRTAGSDLTYLTD